MVDGLQVVIVVIVIFVLILSTEILFSCCRLYHWIKKRIDGYVDHSIVPPGRYRRSSISHNWSEASVVKEQPDFGTLGQEHEYNAEIEEQHQQHQQQQRATINGPHRPNQPYSYNDNLYVSEASIHVSDNDNTNTTAKTTKQQQQQQQLWSSSSSSSSTFVRESSSSSNRKYAKRLEAETADISLHRRRRSSSTGLPGDRILLATDYIKTLELEWASGQFVCGHCKASLSGQRYILHDDKSYCRRCYEKLFANVCTKCKTPITCDFKDLSCKNRHWHDKCFRCSGCLASLVEKPFAYKEHQLYCAPCYENRFAARCTLCGNIFRAGMKKYEYKGRQWHAECFCCKVCQKLIGTSSFVPKGDDVICVPCYEKQLGQNCARCQQMISKGGIIYKNTTWHRDCFQCSHCQKSLANARYTSVDQRPICTDCYGLLYAKKCEECKKPITGLDDVTFISFDNRHWHKDCFRCGKCGSGLYGKGFMTEEGSVLCPNCCKEA